MNAKEMLAKANKEKRVIWHKDRVSVKITKEHYIKSVEGGKKLTHIVGKVYHPHRLMGEQMVKEGWAEFTPDSPAKFTNVIRRKSKAQ